MAYATNALIRKHSENKVLIVLALDDVDKMFDKFKNNEGFVMAHVEKAGDLPVIYLNGEQVSLSDWSVICGTKQKEELGDEVTAADIEHYKKRYFGYPIGMLVTAGIWMCKKVKDSIFSY